MLKRLVEDCESTSRTVQAQNDYLERDGLKSGLRSDDTLARLLELEDSKADIDSCISLACSIELSSAKGKVTAMANGDSLVTSGTAQAKIEVN